MKKPWNDTRWGRGLRRLAHPLLPVSLFVAAASVLSLLRHYSFSSYEDLAMFDQMLWSVRQGQGLVTSLSGNHFLMFPHHFFGEHVSPILYLLAWPAGLTRGPEALLVMQALAVGLAAWPAAAWAAARLGRPRAAVLWATAWLMLPGLWMGVFNDFHMDAFGPLFFFLFLLALYRGATWQIWVTAALWASVKEDAPFYLAFTAAAGGWLSGRRRAGFAVAGAALVYGLLAVFWIGPAFSPTGKMLLLSRLGEASEADAAGAAGAALREHLQDIVRDPVRWTWLRRHLAAFGFLPLLGGVAALPAALCTGLMWLSTSETQHKILIYYPFALYPLLFFAAVEALRWLSRRAVLQALRRARGAAAIAPVVLLLAAGYAWKPFRREVADNLGEASPTFAAAMRPLRAMLRELPKEGSLSCDLYLASHLARRVGLSVLLQPTREADWLVCQVNPHHYAFPIKARDIWLRGVAAPDSDYGLWAFSDHGVAVFRKGHSPRDNPRFLRHHRAHNEIEGLYHLTGRMTADRKAGNGWAWYVGPGFKSETAFFGPYVDLEPGRYRVRFRLRTNAREPGLAGSLRVTGGRGERVFATAPIPARGDGGYQDVVLEVLLDPGEDIEFCGIYSGNGRVWFDHIDYTRLPDAPPRENNSSTE